MADMADVGDLEGVMDDRDQILDPNDMTRAGNDGVTLAWYSLGDMGLGPEHMHIFNCFIDAYSGTQDVLTISDPPVGLEGITTEQHNTGMSWSLPLIYDRSSTRLVGRVGKRIKFRDEEYEITVKTSTRESPHTAFGPFQDGALATLLTHRSLRTDIIGVYHGRQTMTGLHVSN